MSPSHLEFTPSLSPATCARQPSALGSTIQPSSGPLGWPLVASIGGVKEGTAHKDAAQNWAISSCSAPRPGNLNAMAVMGGAVAWLRLVLFAFGVAVAMWALLAVLARRLPPGAARDLATVLPACATAARRLRRDPRVPRRARVAVVIALLWVLSPIDLIPEFLPIIGPLDDVIVVALAFRYAARQVPREVLFEAWPAEPRILERLIGQQRSPP